MQQRTDGCKALLRRLKHRANLFLARLAAVAEDHSHLYAQQSMTVSPFTVNVRLQAGHVSGLTLGQDASI